MGLDIFLFALMVFGMVLIIVAMVLHAKRQREEGMTEQEYAQKEEKLMMLYFEVEDMLNGLKEYVENSREVLGLEYERAEALMTGLSIQPVSEVADMTMSEPQLPLRQAGEASGAAAEEEADDDDRKKRYEKATEMLRRNVSPAKIAEELHLSKSEIAFLRRLAGPRAD